VSENIYAKTGILEVSQQAVLRLAFTCCGLLLLVSPCIINALKAFRQSFLHIVMLFFFTVLLIIVTQSRC
jgi:hypothetical protein